jgi:hypothetical protein
VSCLLCPSTTTGTDLITCWACRDRLAEQLDPGHAGDFDRRDPPSVPRLYAMIDPGKHGGGEGGRAAPGIIPAIPIDAGSVSLTDRRSKCHGQTWQDRAWRWVWEPGYGSALLCAPVVLDGWAREVSRLREVERADRPDRRPMDYDRIGPMTRHDHRRAVRPYAPRLGDLARFLIRHLDWCCAQPWIPDMAREVTRLHIQLRDATAHLTGEHRPVWVGRCAQPRPGTEADPAIDARTDPLQGRPRCNTPLYSPRYGDVVVCSGCGSWWGRDNYLDRAGVLEAAS